MPDPTTWNTRRILTLLALGTLVVSLVWRLPEELGFLSERLGELLVMLTFAASLTYLLRPLVNALCNSKLLGSKMSGHGKRGLAAALVFILIGGATYGFGAVSWRQISGEVREMPLVQSYTAKTPTERRAMLKDWRGTLKSALQPQIAAYNLDESTVDNSLDWVQKRAQEAGPQLRAWGAGLSHRLTFIVELLILPVLVFYFLSDGLAIRRETELLVPLGWRARFSHALTHFDRVFGGYVRGQVIMCVIAWVLVSAALALLRVPHWFTLGLIAGVTRAVPIIGPLLGGVPLLLVTFLETGSPGTTLILLGGFTLMHIVESKILLPRIVGHEVDLHPVSVLIALIIGLEFFGFLGVFLSVPFAATAKIFLSEWHDAIAQRDAQKLATANAAPIETPKSELPTTPATSPPSPPPLNGTATSTQQTTKSPTKPPTP